MTLIYPKIKTKQKKTRQTVTAKATRISGKLSILFNLRFNYDFLHLIYQFV